MLSSEDITFINSHLLSCESFAMVLLPHSSQPLKWLRADTSMANGINLHISPWLSTFQSSILNLKSQDTEHMLLNRHSTSLPTYLHSARHTIANCAHRKGKTVLSKVVCGNLTDTRNWSSVADELFGLYPSTFRFIFFTPETGGWLGASPELLLEVDKNTGRFSTMSLAGTRRHSPAHSEPWDAKNIEENNFVSSFLAGELNSVAQDITMSALHTQRYDNNIEHLQRMISGRVSLSDTGKILDIISPTPALCGYPRKEAIEDIQAYESHKRHCYGGYLALDSTRSLLAFVVLRCINFRQQQYCVYGGGGLTHQSKPDEEWIETENKIQTLLSVLHSSTNHS